MRNIGSKLIPYIISVSALLSLSPGHTEPLRAASDQDHIYAWVPLTEAATAGVAQARVHILLSKATRAAEAELCEGNWIITPRQRTTTSPTTVRAPQKLGGQSSWYYQVSHEAIQLAGCPGVPTFTFQQVVSRHLPQWILLQPARQLSLLQQGIAMINTPGDQALQTPVLALNQ